MLSLERDLIAKLRSLILCVNALQEPCYVVSLRSVVLMQHSSWPRRLVRIEYRMLQNCRR